MTDTPDSKVLSEAGWNEELDCMIQALYGHTDSSDEEGDQEVARHCRDLLWQDREALRAENERLREALRELYEYNAPGNPAYPNEQAMLKRARAAIDKKGE